MLQDPGLEPYYEREREGGERVGAMPARYWRFVVDLYGCSSVLLSYSTLFLFYSTLLFSTVFYSALFYDE